MTYKLNGFKPALATAEEQDLYHDTVTESADFFDGQLIFHVREHG